MGGQHDARQCPGSKAGPAPTPLTFGHFPFGVVFPRPFFPCAFHPFSVHCLPHGHHLGLGKSKEPSPSWGKEVLPLACDPTAACSSAQAPGTELLFDQMLSCSFLLRGDRYHEWVPSSVVPWQQEARKAKANARLRVTWGQGNTWGSRLVSLCQQKQQELLQLGHFRFPLSPCCWDKGCLGWEFFPGCKVHFRKKADCQWELFKFCKNVGMQLCKNLSLLIFQLLDLFKV